jgi:hypothetical protein
MSQILAWADDYKRRIGRWPNLISGRIKPTDETWLGINSALRRGYRGLPVNSSLANILYLHRGVRNLQNLPVLDRQQILRWAEAHFRRTGVWPSQTDGAIHGAPGETWHSINYALTKGTRGHRGGSSLALFLAAFGWKHKSKSLPPLRVSRILAWADAFFDRHHYWPSRDSGPVAESPLDSWSMIDTALRRGLRDLPGGSSLPAFLNQHRNLFQGKSRRPKKIQKSERLHVEVILAWGKAHRRKTGAWPNRYSGRIAGVPKLKWSAVDAALKQGHRGLSAGSSLAKLFAGRRWTARGSNFDCFATYFEICFKTAATRVADDFNSGNFFQQRANSGAE